MWYKSVLVEVATLNRKCAQHRTAGGWVLKPARFQRGVTKSLSPLVSPMHEGQRQRVIDTFLAGVPNVCPALLGSLAVYGTGATQVAS